MKGSPVRSKRKLCGTDERGDKTVMDAGTQETLVLKVTGAQ